MTMMGNTVYPQFRDSTNLECLRGYDRVTLYMDGDFNQSEAIDDFQHVRLITIFGNLEAGILDYEEGNPLYEDFPAVRNYLIGRSRLDRRGRLYTDRDNLINHLWPNVKDLPHEWCIATLDNYPWTPMELVNDILDRSNGEIHLDVSTIWSNQWKRVENVTTPPGFDQSSLYRVW